MQKSFHTHNKKESSRAVRRNTFFIIHWLAKRIPSIFFKPLIPLLSAAAQFFLKKKKAIILDNLKLAFGDEKSLHEIKCIAKDCFEGFGFSMIDLVYLMDRPNKIMKNVTVEGINNLDRALANGQGAILLSAHFGNFGLMFLRIAASGYKVNCIMRHMRDRQFEKYVFDYSQKMGLNPIFALPQKQCLVDSLASLRANQSLFILLDQNHGSGGVFVDFFGRPAATATGPVILSRRSGAPILPIFIVNAGIGKYSIIIEPPVKFQENMDEKTGIVNNTAHLTKIIERYVRKYPSQWGGWLHRRWKSQPVAV